jgi:hypothetical protein
MPENSVEIQNLEGKDIEKIKLRLAKIDEPSNKLDCTLYYYQENRTWFVNFRSSVLEGIFSHGDIFSSLCEVRKSLEEIGWYILCNGSRTNAWASTMSRDMGGGFKLYLLTIGEEMDRKKLVQIFDEADFKEMGTVDQQWDFYKRWLRSVGRGFNVEST